MINIIKGSARGLRVTLNIARTRFSLYAEHKNKTKLITDHEFQQKTS